MDYIIALDTNVGIQKKTNQDSCCVRQAVTDRGNILFAVMCDGMGGLSKGEVASASLVNVFAEWFENEFPLLLHTENVLKEVEYRWNAMIKEQNTVIAAYGSRCNIQLGSTITMLLILEDGGYIIAHVGDSRAYRISDSSIELLTEDQTFVANEIKAGRLTPEAAEVDPRRNVLMQCVGASCVVEPAFYYGASAEGECYMLCSDGFRHVISHEEIQNAFAPSSNPDDRTMAFHIGQMINLNMFRHENDNITAILIKTV